MPVTPHSRKVRTAARGLLSTVLVTAPETRQLLALLSQLSALSDSLARLRETQGRAAQAHADQLHDRPPDLDVDPGEQPGTAPTILLAIGRGGPRRWG